jgi:hypothetical protein
LVLVEQLVTMGLPVVLIIIWFPVEVLVVLPVIPVITVVPVVVHRGAQRLAAQVSVASVTLGAVGQQVLLVAVAVERVL